MAITRYVESGYVEAGYVEVIVDVNIGTLTANPGDTVSASFSLTCDAIEFLSDERYVEAGYVEAGYVEVTKFLEPLTLNTTLEISADLTEVTAIEASASISSAFSLSSTIGTLEDADASFSIAFSQTADGERLPSGGANLSSSFSTNINIEKILDADATLNTAVDVTASGDRTVDASANFGGIFSPNVIVGVLKIIDATLDSSVDLSATISKFTGNEATLSNIVNLSLQGAKTAGYNASFSSAFSQTSTANLTASTDATLSAQFSTSASVGELFDPAFQNETEELTSEFSVSITPRVLVRATSITNDGDSLVTFDSSNKEFGTHSLKLQFGNSIAPSYGGAIYDGSNFYLFDNGYTWTSSNGTTWTRSTNNLSVTIANTIKYVNNTFVVRYNQYIYHSTNGTSWTTLDLGSQIGTSLGSNTIAHDGSNWFIGATNSTFNQHRWYKKSTLTGDISTWTLDTSINVASGDDTARFAGVAQNGNTIAWLYESRDPTPSTTYRKYIRIGSNSYYVSNDVYRASYNATGNVLNYINGAYTFMARDDGNQQHKIYSTTTGSSISTSSAYSTVGTTFDWIDYFNSRYIVGSRKRILTGTTISNLSNTNAPVPENGPGTYTTKGASDGTTYVLHQSSNGRVVSSTNGSTFTSQGYITDTTEYPYVGISRGDNGDFDSWKTIDFRYYYISNNDTAPLYIRQSHSSGYSSVGAQQNWMITAHNNIAITDSQSNTTSGGSPVANSWNHVRVVNDASGCSVYLNGTRVINTTALTLVSSGLPITIQTSSYASSRIDELLVSDDALNSSTETSITVPTSAFENGTNTDLLMHFDGDFTDDSRFSSTVDPEVDITAVASIIASIGGSFTGDASINSAFTQTADVDAFLGGNATLSTQATVTATATRIQQGASSISSAVTVSVDAVKTTDVDSTQSSEFTTQIDGGAIRNAIGDFDSIATQLTAASKIGDFFINADSQFTATATAVKTTDIDDVLSSSFALTASETTLFKAFDSSVSSAFATSVTATKTTDVDSTQTSAFAQTASGDRIRFGVSSVTANANLVVETSPLRDAEANLSSSFVQPTTTGLRIKQLDATVNSALTVTADAIKAVSASGTASSAFTQSTDVNRTRDVDADFDSVATQLTAVAKIGDFLINADVQASLTATARKTTGNVIAIDTQFVITAIPGAIRQGASTQTSAFTVEAEGTSNITGESQLDTAVTVSADAIKTVEASASFGGAGGFVVAAVATRNNEIIAGISSTLTADVKRIRLADATLSTAITTQITAGKRVEVASSINSSVTISATVRVVNIDDIVYTIPAETREYSIVAETREYTIVSETREYTVT